MGNTNSLQDLDSRYTELRIQQNELLSNLIVIEDNTTKELFMIKQMNIANEIEYHRLVKELKQRKILSEKKAGRHLIQLKHYDCKQFNEICGKTFKLILRLEYLENNLKDIHNDRKTNKLPFTEEEVTDILRSVVNSLIILHDNNYKNIHIYKESIFLAQKNYKLVDTQLSNRIHPYYEIANAVPVKTGTYLAPELLNEIHKGNSDFYQTPKADIFTLAVIALQLCTFCQFDCLYDYQRKTMDIQGLTKAAENIQYSPNLKNILLRMLVEEEEERVGLISLKQMLGGVEQSSCDSRIFKSVSDHNTPANQTERTFTSRSNVDTVTPVTLTKPQIMKLPPKMQGRTYLKTYQPISDYSNRPFPVMYEASNSTAEEGVSNRVYASSRTVFRSIEPATVHQPPKPLQRKQPRPQLFSTEPKRLKFTFPQQLQTPVHILYKQPSPDHEDKPLGKAISTTVSQAPLSNSFSTNIFNNKTYGKHLFNNGARYEGQFNANNEFDGNGILYYPDGQLCYSGSWKSNSFHGFGVLHNEHPNDTREDTNYYNFNFTDTNNWKYYEGEFDEDKKQGFGTLFMMNGDKFSGCFKNDTVEGFGTFFLAKENRNVNGIWIQNMLKR